MSFNDKKNRKYKSDFGSLGGIIESKLSSKSSKETEKSSKRDQDKSSRRLDEKSRDRDVDKERDRDRDVDKERDRDRDRDKDRKSRSHRDHDVVEEKSSKHRSKHRESADEYESKRTSKDKDKKEQHRSSKHRDGEEEDTRKHREHKSEHRRKHRDNDSEEEQLKENGNFDEPNYEDDFENDFEKDDNDEIEAVPKKESRELRRESNNNDDDDDDNNYKASRRHHRESTTKEKTSSHRHKYNEYDDYDDYAEDNEIIRGRVVKANAHVNVPTELVEVYASEVYFNHDSKDKQRRRAKDLFKNMIELDKKATFNLLDINPVQMRTVYSTHLKHEKVQTNDDILEIETQTDDIELVTRWTQHPADDLKGYGIEDQKFNYDSSNDILEQFRTDINVSSLQKFLQKSSKVVETLLRETTSLGRVLAENKSDLEFSQGFSIFGIPKHLSKLSKSIVLTNVVFAQDNPNHLVCSYDMQLGLTSSTLLFVWDIDEPKVPYRILTCETVSTFLCYFSFIVVSGNTDGSIDLWDLRESPSLHSRNVKKISESNVIRSPTYTTAGVLLEENHLSEVKSILTLQNQTTDANREVFMQLATLEIDCKLIIWTVVELKNADLSVFETDLGLIPGGKVQLVKSYQIVLNNIITTIFGKCEYQTWNMTVSTERKNHFFISTNIGQIIHIERKGKSFSSSVMKTPYSDMTRFLKTPADGIDLSADGLLSVKSVSFHHELSDILLASYGNGEIRLYHVNFPTPIKTWLFMLGNEIKEAKWIESRSSCFMVLDEDASKLFVWDLLADDTQPVLIKKIKNFGYISFPSVNLKEGQVVGKDGLKIPFAYFERNSQDLQVHLFAPDWTRKSDKEAKKFAKLIKNYLLTF